MEPAGGNGGYIFAFSLSYNPKQTIFGGVGIIDRNYSIIEEVMKAFSFVQQSVQRESAIGQKEVSQNGSF